MYLISFFDMILAHFEQSIAISKYSRKYPQMESFWDMAEYVAVTIVDHPLVMGQVVPMCHILTIKLSWGKKTL